MSSAIRSTNMHKRSVNLRPEFDPEEFFRGKHRTTQTSLWCTIRCILRLSIILLLSLVGCGIQITCLLIPGHMKRRFPLIFWRIVCWIMGIQIRTLGHREGHISSRQDGRRVIFVANHTSWIDILILGATLPTFFIAKTEVRSWPFIGFLTKLGRTIYITRNRNEAGQNVHDIRQQLHNGYNITFFPEGTTSDGKSVKPFLSSLFAIAKPIANHKKDLEEPLPLIVQPISVTYDRLEGLPVGKMRRTSVFSWFGDMYLVPHLWSLCKWRSMRASVFFHEPLCPEDFSTRKALSTTSYNLVRRGNEALCQNRVDPTNPHSL